ncbi:hypothetical protein [Paractinoplanes atraurantiacus]|uniref:Uncharacterized protein n=1 Tax=Paractinoplanes atraurantiacus TaxID=1036182 RepID=A0A285GXY3_9ACTN|nr:hypothetical protein [Actinoplanes atraurantiacus]SNY28164.1 hypothetical protein SAMN05421748_10336 [Actinoplanes atraurantiacus]
MTAEQRPPVRGYAKPVVVPERLDSLTGPTTGIVVLPRHLKWSGNSRYDLDQPGRIADLYRTVLNEAATSDDLSRYLDRATLLDLWSSMWLPVALRGKWEDRFPELRHRRYDPAA